MVNILTGTAFDARERMHHREEELSAEFPSSVSSRVRNLLALKAQNWRAGGSPTPPVRTDYISKTTGTGNINGAFYIEGLATPDRIISFRARWTSSSNAEQTFGVHQGSAMGLQVGVITNVAGGATDFVFCPSFGGNFSTGVARDTEWHDFVIDYYNHTITTDGIVKGITSKTGVSNWGVFARANGTALSAACLADCAYVVAKSATTGETVASLFPVEDDGTGAGFRDSVSGREYRSPYLAYHAT